MVVRSEERLKDCGSLDGEDRGRPVVFVRAAAYSLKKL